LQTEASESSQSLMELRSLHVVYVTIRRDGAGGGPRVDDLGTPGGLPSIESSVVLSYLCV